MSRTEAYFDDKKPNVYLTREGSNYNWFSGLSLVKAQILLARRRLEKSKFCSISARNKSFFSNFSDRQRNNQRCMKQLNGFSKHCLHMRRPGQLGLWPAGGLVVAAVVVAAAAAERTNRF